MAMRWENMTAGKIIETLSKAPKDYEVFLDSGCEYGGTLLTGVILDVDTNSIIFVNNFTISNYWDSPKRYKILGHGKEKS